MSHRRAFTVIELLVVIAIIGVLAGVLYPVIAGARKRSRVAVCTSNLRQCGVALRLYMNDYATEVPPDDQMAHELLKKMPTCCPNDKEWTKGCTLSFGRPLIGSYAYVRSLLDIDNPAPEILARFYNSMPDYVWLADIFHSTYGIPAPYHAEREDSADYRHRVMLVEPWERYVLPNSIIRLFDDGHVNITKPVHHPHSYTGSITCFDWGVVFNLPSETELTPVDR